MSKLLTLKHWQLFGLLFGLPMIFQFVIIISIMINKNSTMMFVVFPLIIILYIGLYFGWFYALGTNLYKMLPDKATMNLKIFKIFLFIPVAYILFLSVFMAAKISIMLNGEQANFASFALIIPLHLFSIFCIFYSIYFIAKALKSVELQREVSFSDYAGDCFLIWFLMIGVWIIQPRINKIFNNTINNDINQTLDKNIQ